MLELLEYLSLPDCRIFQLLAGEMLKLLALEFLELLARVFYFHFPITFEGCNLKRSEIIQWHVSCLCCGGFIHASSTVVLMNIFRYRNLERG
jgi:hypothetical protein